MRNLKVAKEYVAILKGDSVWNERISGTFDDHARRYISLYCKDFPEEAKRLKLDIEDNFQAYVEASSSTVTKIENLWLDLLTFLPE